MEKKNRINKWINLSDENAQNRRAYALQKIIYRRMLSLKQLSIERHLHEAGLIMMLKTHVIHNNLLTYKLAYR